MHCNGDYIFYGENNFIHAYLSSLQPTNYVAHLIGHEGKGSLLSLLREKGWCNKLQAGPTAGAKGFMFFTVEVDLTEKGEGLSPWEYCQKKKKKRYCFLVVKQTVAILLVPWLSVLCSNLIYICRTRGRHHDSSVPVLGHAERERTSRVDLQRVLCEQHANNYSIVVAI